MKDDEILSDKEEMIFAFHGYPSEAKQKEETLSDHAEKVYEDVWYPEKDVKEAVQKLKEEIKEGCGNEYLRITEDDEWELMCGKHIWKSEKVVSQYNLCEDCLERLEEIDKIFGEKLT